jgi:hypothetical protein
MIAKVVSAARTRFDRAAAAQTPLVSLGWPKRSARAEVPSSSDSPSHFANACLEVQPAGTVNVYP